MSQGYFNPSRRRRGGLTFVELLLGLVITAIISLAIASMLFAMTRGTASVNDMRGLLIQQKLLGERLDASLRGSTEVLASGSNYLVLWMTDSRANGTPDLSELRRIEYDSVNHRVISYRMPSTWTQSQIDANEVNYSVTDDFNAKTNAVKGTSSFPAEVWSTSIYGLTLTLDAAVPDTALVSYRATVQSGTQQATATGAAALRN